MRAISSMVVLVLLGCSHQPARFADRTPVSEIRDDQPIAVPARSQFIEAVHLSDVYLRRPLVDALDAERFPYAHDVNALDEVPRSSWWSPPPLEPDAFARAYRVDGPPEPPLSVIAAQKGERHVIDRRGLRYLVESDPEGMPATRSAAAVIASRLVRAVGYRTPAVWRYGDRAVATRWPIGIDLGPTAMSGTRSDDPNDRIEHRDRRTLRALGLLAAWLEIRDLGARRLLDVYVGSAGRGHVLHYVVGLRDALGAGSLGGSGVTETAAGEVRGSAFENLITLGLNKQRDSGPAYRSLRALSPRLARDLELSRPWEPVDRLQPSDGYWMVKRLARLPSSLIERAVAAARLEPDVHEHVVRALEARRTTLIARWLRQVTPLELGSLQGSLLELSDQAIRLGYAASETTRYQVQFIGLDGAPIAPGFVVHPIGSELSITLPAALMADPYLVVRITAERRSTLLPRPFEAHVSTRGSPHVIGIRR